MSNYKIFGKNNIGENLQDVGVEKEFLDLTPKALDLTEKEKEKLISCTS